MATDDLISLAEAKTYCGTTAGMQGFAQDTLLSSLITAASLAIRQACNGTIYIQQSFTEDYDMGKRPGELGNARRVYLLHRPIVSVTSITDDDSSTISSDDYTVIAEQGVLEHDCWWPSPAGRWTVIYTAGKYADLTSVPENVKLACKLEINRLLLRRVPGQTSRNVSGRSGGKSVSIEHPINRSGISDEAYALIQDDIVRWV